MRVKLEVVISRIVIVQVVSSARDVLVGIKMIKNLI